MTTPQSIFIIEDETLLANELVRYFRREGWDVEIAASLEQARRKLVEEHLDPLVILADMTLPDGSSLDLLEALRPEGLGGEWVLLSGFAWVPDSVRAQRLGAYEFLQKPCKIAQLAVTIEGARRSAIARRQLSDPRGSGISQ